MAYSVDLLVAAHTAVRDKILAGVGVLAAHRVYDAADVLLITLPLNAGTVGSVDALTGRLTLAPGADGVGVASGTAAHADLIGNDGDVMASGIPVVAGTSSVAGHLVLTSTAIVPGVEVKIVSSTIG